jgi:dihydroorotase
MQIPAFSDYHVHVRQGERLKDVVPYTTACCGRFLAMPNTNPSITNALKMLEYKEEIYRAVPHFSDVLMTIKLVEDTEPATIKDCADRGCTAVKIYPIGVTTNSEDGISLQTLNQLLEITRGSAEFSQSLFFRNLMEIEDSDLVLCIHGELPGEEVLEREKAMLPFVEAILHKFRRLRVVLEHITTKEAVNFVSRLDYHYKGRIAATITPHHLMYTITDLLGDKLRPHLFCKPVLKNRADQEALKMAAISGRKCFFLGSDSAPWGRSEKECDHGCAGVWTAPALVPTILELFEAWQALNMVEGFTSTFGDLFYKKEPVERILTVEKGVWVMNAEIKGMVPFRAGEVMRWRINGIC